MQGKSKNGTANIRKNRCSKRAGLTPLINSVLFSFIFSLRLCAFAGFNIFSIYFSAKAQRRQVIISGVRSQETEYRGGEFRAKIEKP
jgi:hypothetical protein